MWNVEIELTFIEDLPFSDGRTVTKFFAVKAPDSSTARMLALKQLADSLHQYGQLKNVVSIGIAKVTSTNFY